MNDLRLTALILTVLCGPLVAQTPVPPAEEPEAPEALFQQKIGDADVELDAEGTWVTHFATGWGSGFTPEGSLPGLGYPGLAKGPEFEQIPDFSLTLWLLKRYYLEVNYRTSTNDKSFLLGYQGQQGELLQWAKLGNASFSVPARAGEQLPAGRPGAPAAGAAFSLGNVSLETLARYEDGSRETHTYRGYNDVSLATVGLETWIRGRFFRVPGTSGIRVLVEDPAGVFGGFRDAAAGEVVIDSTGQIRLPASAAKRYLVTWVGASGDVGPTAKLKITSKVFTATGLPAGSWYVLTQPGTSTAFELRNRYPVPAGTTGQILLYDNDSGLPVTGKPVSQSPTNDWFEVSGDPEAPFFNDGNFDFEGIYPYGGEGVPPASGKVLPWSFHLPVTNATSYSLGTDVIPNSIIVIRNGLTTTAWKFDATSGTLVFDTPVFDTDTIVISLQRQTTANTASDLVVWHGGRWDISEKQNLEWNVQSRWNLSKDQTTNEDLQSPGRVATSVAWTGSEGEWNWVLRGTAGALKADSTGHRVVYGQGESGVQASLDGDALRPSAAPDQSLSALGIPGSLTESNRAPVFYRNYWSNDPLTGAPVPGNWSKPGVGQEPQIAGGNIGPYLVLGDGQRPDRMAVLETQLNNNEWAGMQVFVDKGHADDLRSASAVTVNIRVPTTAIGSDRIFLQAGALSTNFDGTRAVRAITYKAQPSLPFFNADPAVAATQYFPIPEGSVWGNDPANIGTTVPDGDLVSLDLTGSSQFSASSTDWQTLRLVLSDSDRQKLQAATGWRLVVYSATGGSRTILVGPVVFEGSTWSVISDKDATGSVNPAEVDFGNSRQLRVDWNNRTTWTVQGRQNPVRPLSYGTIAFKYQVTGLTDPSTTLSVKLSDYKGRGITASWTVPNTDTAIHQARIAIRGKTLTLDGVPAGTVTLSSGALLASWDRMTIMQTGASSGTLTVSEVEAVDAQWEPVGTTFATATWTQAAPWPSTEVPVVSGMTVGLTSQQEGLTAETASWRGQTSWNGSLGPLRSSGLASYATTPEGTQAHGEYQATLPLIWPGGPSLALTDQFSDEGLRSERAVLGVPVLGTFDTMVKASGPPLTLDQDYRASWNGAWTDWAASLSAEWNQSRPFLGTVGNFGEQWVDSWTWLAPGADIAPYYLIQSQATLRTPFLWGPLDATARGQVTQSVGPTTTWSPTASWQLRSTMRLGDSGWSLMPSVSRQVAAVFDRAAVAPQSSASTAASWIWSQPNGLLSLPFTESGGSPWTKAPDGLDSATLQSSGNLDWQRNERQDWTDLTLPRSGGFAYTATRGLDGLAEYRSYEVGGHLEAQAINLFGSLGSQPVFNWYRTDVWTWTTSGSWQTGTRVQDRLAQASAALRSELVLTVQESVALPATYQGVWGQSPSQTWNLQPTWSLKRPADLPFDLPRWLSPRSFQRQWIQEVSTALVFGWTPQPAPPLRDLHVTWKGRFLLSDKSELDFTTQWGQQWQNNLTVVGLEVAVDFILSF